MSHETTGVPTVPDPEESGLGPAMLALTAAQRRFAIAAVQFPLAKDWQIARAAGYSAVSHGALRVRAHEQFHNEKVLEAIKELADKEIRGSALLGIATMKKIARLDGHKDQLKAATAILDRAGFGVEQTINVNKTVTRKVDVSEAALRIAEFRQKFPEQFAKLLGAPVPEPVVVDGEFSEVTE